MKILDNPREYLESLSDKEFKDMLDKYGFEYKSTKDLTDKEKEDYLKYLENMKNKK